MCTIRDHRGKARDVAGHFSPLLRYLGWRNYGGEGGWESYCQSWAVVLMGFWNLFCLRFACWLVVVFMLTLTLTLTLTLVLRLATHICPDSFSHAHAHTHLRQSHDSHRIVLPTSGWKTEVF
jgi:hypothetical protein